MKANKKLRRYKIYIYYIFRCSHLVTKVFGSDISMRNGTRVRTSENARKNGEIFSEKLRFHVSHWGTSRNSHQETTGKVWLDPNCWVDLTKNTKKRSRPTAKWYQEIWSDLLISWREVLINSQDTFAHRTWRGPDTWPRIGSLCRALAPRGILRLRRLRGPPTQIDMQWRHMPTFIKHIYIYSYANNYTIINLYKLLDEICTPSIFIQGRPESICFTRPDTFGIG